MSFLRSKFFLAIVSLFVLTGYSLDLFADCCTHREQGQTENGKSAPNDQTPGGGDGCQCICHQIIDPLTPGPTRVADAAFTPLDFVAHADEFPPDAVPLGIEHPPQIA